MVQDEDLVTSLLEDVETEIFKTLQRDKVLQTKGASVCCCYFVLKPLRSEFLNSDGVYVVSIKFFFYFFDIIDL